jgi:hypothetical protein
MIDMTQESRPLPEVVNVRLLLHTRFYSDITDRPVNPVQDSAVLQAVGFIANLQNLKTVDKIDLGKSTAEFSAGQILVNKSTSL